MPLELLWLLLPVAAASGWLMARRRPPRGDGDLRIEPEYFKGIDYLLNEQPDKAIEALLQVVQVDSETVEPHFALGNLFRRQGEVERAIRIHQSLVARPLLTRTQRDRALFELGRDYYQAGLLDRAENLFRETVERDPGNAGALRLLGKIYEQESEWEKAIAASSPLEGNRAVIANYYCELAAQAFAAGDHARAKKMLRRAYFKDRRCVRASLLAGGLARAEGNFKTAIKALQRVNRQDPHYLPEIVVPLLECYDQIGRPEQAIDFLGAALQRQNAFPAVLIFARYLGRHRGEAEAHYYIVSYLQSHPSLSGLAHLLESLREEEASGLKKGLEMGSRLLVRLLDNTPAYYCINCGFRGKSLHWHCPGCRQWNSIRPYQG
jgi:lipopolysaccharide biosynthesis regulator YciM